MIVDSSALLAILFEEPELPVFTRAMELASSRRISAATYLEIGIVLDVRRWSISNARMNQFLSEMKAIIEPVTEVQARLARDAHRRYGRASGHHARLNFGDCFAYALAREKDEPLLFKGTDFAHTDVRVALAWQQEGRPPLLLSLVARSGRRSYHLEGDHVWVMLWAP